MHLKSVLALSAAAVFVVGCGGGEWPPKNAKEEVVETHPDGSKKKVIRYAGQKTNLVSEVFYFPDGKTQSAKNFKKGKPDGAQTVYNLGGIMIQETNYADSVRHGTDKLWYDDGQLKSEGQYENGEPVGKFVSYFQDGKVSIEVAFKEGKKDGEETEYHPNGNKKRVRTFVLGDQEGPQLEFFLNGNPKSEYIYVNNALNGPFKVYSEKTGKVVESGEYLKGQYNGNREMFDEKSGRRKSLAKYENGKMTFGQSF